MGNKKQIGVLLSEKDLKRRYPDSGLASEICLPGDKTLRLPCRVLSMNHHLGGGIPYGKILEVFGEESTGKSLWAMDFGVVCQSLGGIILWNDAEASWDPEWAEKHGIDLSRVVLLPNENRIEIISDWVADMCIYWRSKLTNNEPILLVGDSMAVYETTDAMQTAQVDTKAEMGKRSFKMGEMLRKRTRIFAKFGITVLFINQLRKKFGATMFEDPDTTPMSQCMKYYASQRVGLYRGKRIKKGNETKGKWIGNIVYVRTKKNKTSAPKDNVKSRVYFEEYRGQIGYHKYYGFPELLKDKGILKITGEEDRAKYYYKDKLLAKGEDNFLALLAENNELRSKFIKKLKVNTPSGTRKKLENISSNLYPVKAKKKKDEEGDEE